MIRVSNGKCIRRLAWKSLAAARTRNRVAVLAIALTTVLFTTLFTIAMSINDGFQQSNFRQVGGFSHGGFKYLTEAQAEELKDDPLIQAWGLRRFLGMPTEPPFHKSHVEISYADANEAHWMFCDPVEGRLPQEGTNEAATDTRVLALLGVEPELGAEFSVTFSVDGHETTQTFTLCGWWEYDTAVVANHILIPESRVDAILDEVGITPPGQDGMTGSWNLDVMLGSSLHIERDLDQILYNHGYQRFTAAEDGYIRTGVNWGYTGAQLAVSLDPVTALAIAALMLLIVFTGYLIIYNVFQISVTNDIRFYGLLKTIGTTPRQLRRIIRHQALTLSLAGIPLGLVLGWLTGIWLTPAVVAHLDGVAVVASASPVIFVAAALFSLVTVLLSCRKPGRVAARVSPIEAVRYTEGGGVKRKSRKSGRRVSPFSMARANLGRSRGKTAVTVISLTLAVVLLTVSVTFANSFDMDKYISAFTASDFILADAGQFQTGGEVFNEVMAVSEEVIDAIQAQGGVAEGGRVYGRTTDVEEFVTEDYYRATYWNDWLSPEQLTASLDRMERNEAGLLADTAQLYGMEPFALDQLTVLEGDLSKLKEPGGSYIAAVYSEDDYGNPHMDSHWARLGDTVTLRYVERYEYVNPDTGEVYPENTDLSGLPWTTRAAEYRDVTYEVAALVEVPYALSYRYFGSDEFILNDQTFLQDTGSGCVMYYAFNAGAEANDTMEAFLKNYTENIDPQYDYESKATYAAEFESFRSMFLLLGGVLSFIVALVGVLNYFNAILTGIIARKREFAVLQSIGMTGGQLKRMLVYEGLFYALGAVALALALTLLLSPLLGTALNSVFWFFTYRFTVSPILAAAPVFALLGVLVPLAVYRAVARYTIVERLREADA